MPARPRTTRAIPELAPEPARAAAPAPAAASEDGGDLAAGYASLERLIAERGLPLGSLDELLGAPTVVGPAALALPSEEDVVPIEALAPDESQRTFAAVVAPPPGSRPGARATAPDEPEGTVVPIETLAPEVSQRTPAAVVAPPPGSRPGASATAPDEEAIVPIESLLYRGPGALRRALELRGELATLAAAPGSVSPRLLDLQREVFDLVELGLSAQR